MHTYVRNLLLLLILSALVFLTCLRQFCRVTRNPDSFTYILITQLVKDTITCQDNKVMLLSNLKCLNFRYSLHNIGIASPILKLSLRISKSSTHGESTRQDSYRTDNELWIDLAFLLGQNMFFVVQSLSRRRLIHLASCCYDSLVLIYVRWLVITAQSHHLLSSP